ncbi:MAG: molybdopterin molybdenumtransferase MoeA [Candidatus Planktophila sp.]|nr:molybdopterin molybdenumtransferase MoeA [Candidatus Planktophila sp.]
MSALIEGSWDQARKIASQSFSALPSELIDVSHGVDRTLATDAHALCDLPTYATSAMDGYAVAGTGPWTIVGEVKAGLPMKGELADATAVGIATGGVIPAGTFGVIRWEIAKVSGNILKGDVVENHDIRPAAHECKSGDLLVKAGAVLNPGKIGLLSAAGLDHVSVTRKPRVALVLLGDEIQLEGVPSEGLIRDALGPQLPGWLEKMGCEIVATQYISDEISRVVKALSDACALVDIVITTGGTAQGPRDFLHDALIQIDAEILVDTVAVRPGHPMLLARTRTTAIFGLPGNPQSAIVALMSLGAPVIASMLGQSQQDLPTVITRRELTAPTGFTRLVIGNIVDAQFEVGQYLGSAMLRGLAHSTGFAVVTKELTAAGESVRWLWLP